MSRKLNSLFACGVLLTLGDTALCQTTDWTVAPSAGWQVINPVLSGGNLTFTVSPATVPNPVTFKGAGGVFCDGVSSCSWNYLVNSASNSLLIEWADDNPPCYGGTAIDDVASVTFDGVAATFLGKRVSNIGQRLHYVYGLMNPHVGSHPVKITLGHVTAFRTLASDYANVSGFGAIVVNSHAAGNCTGDTALTTTLTTTAPNSLIYLGVLDSVSGLAGDPGTVVRSNNMIYVWNFDSGAPIASPGPYSMTTRVSPAGQSMSHIAVELKN